MQAATASVQRDHKRLENRSFISVQPKGLGHQRLGL